MDAAGLDAESASDAGVALLSDSGGPWVFVSSRSLSGDSVQDVHELCRELGEKANLGNAWFPWISSVAQDVSDIYFGNGPWYRTDGTLAFDDRDALFTGPKVPINRDESGQETLSDVFTGTDRNGHNTGQNCKEWRSYYKVDDVTLGNSGSVGADWTNKKVTDCGTPRRVYCFQDNSEPFNNNLTLVSRWNELMLSAIRRTNSSPTITTRKMFIVSTAMYDAWSAYSPDADSYAPQNADKRPSNEHSLENQRKAVSYAAYHALIDQFEEYEEGSGHFAQMLSSLGYSITPDESDTAALVGKSAADEIIVLRANDGANESSDYRDQKSEIYPERYKPKNSSVPTRSNSLGGEDFDPNRWTPLRVPTGAKRDMNDVPEVDDNDSTTYFDQSFTTPHWGAIQPFALTSGAQFRPTPPPILGSEQIYTDATGTSTTNDAAYRAQIRELLSFSAQLTEKEKISAEYWADGPRTDSPPGHWNQIAHGISKRDAHTLEDDIKLYFALNAALLDAGIACWDAKRHYDYVRPVTAIHHLYGEQFIEAWAGPNQGTQLIPGNKWRPYQDVRFVTPPFAEYVSGHSVFSRTAAEILILFTGSTTFYDGTSKTGEDVNRDGEEDFLGEHIQQPLTGDFEQIPSSKIILRWSTLIDAADEAGRSRRLGGIHIQDGDLRGRELGRQVAEQAFARAKSYWEGDESNR